MARFLVSLTYNGKDYSVTTTACNENNAIEFTKAKCVEVAHKATGHYYGRILSYICDNCFKAVMI